MATVGHVNARSCRNASTGGFAVADNQATNPIAAAVVDTDGMAYPDLKPTVKKSDAASDVIYGKFDTFDQGSEDVTIVTGGIQSFYKMNAVAAADIGRGIIATTTAGQVDTSATQGTGVVVGRSGTNILWVDLDAGTRGTA